MTIQASSLTLSLIGSGAASAVLRFAGRGRPDTALSRILSRTVGRLSSPPSAVAESVRESDLASVAFTVLASATDVPLAFDTVTADATAEAQASIRTALAAAELKRSLYFRTE